MSAPSLDWKSAMQGDIINVQSLTYWSGPGASSTLELRHGAALVSQTCDLVQSRYDDHILVAPIHECTVAEWSNVRKGRKPLLVAVGSSNRLVADLARIVSLPRSALDSCRTLDRTCDSPSSEDASRLASRIGRAFARFAVPEAVYPVLVPLRQKVIGSYSKKTAFAKVLVRIEEFRISCNDWDSPSRQLSIYAIVGAQYLPAAGSAPAGWTWSAQTVSGAHPAERPGQLNLERLSALILQNLEAGNDSAVLELWRLWGDKMQSEYLSKTDAQVSSIELIVVSDSDFTYAEYVESEVLDFSALSDFSPTG